MYHFVPTWLYLLEKFLEVELQGQKCCDFFSSIEVISLPSREVEQSNGPQLGWVGGVLDYTAVPTGVLLRSQVEDGTGRLFSSRIFLIKSIVEPVFI